MVHNLIDEEGKEDSMPAPLDHVMIRVDSLEESINWYETNLDYEEKGRWEAETFTNVYLGPEDVHESGAAIELTYNHDDRTYDLGDAWGHLAVRVEDVYDAYEELMEQGVEDYRDPDSCGGRYAFIKDPDGHEIELVQRDYGEKWSLDHTMIRVENINETIGWLVHKLEYGLTRRIEYDDFSLYFLAPKDAAPEAMSLELTYNHDDQTYKIGDAWGHVAIRTEDLQERWDTLLRRDALDYRDPTSCNDRYAFTKMNEGHEIELVTR